MKKLHFYIVLLTIVSCSPAVKYSKTEKAGAYLNDSLYGTDSSINILIHPYKDKLDATMNEVLNTSELVMERNVPEGLLGNFVTDLCMTFVRQMDEKVDFCVLNNGGLRVPLPKGNITRGKLFELMPFENELVIVTLDGATVIKLFEYIASKNGIPFSKELKLTYNKWELSSATINNVPFDSTRTYNIITSDYLSRGGDNMDFLADNSKITPVGIKLRDAIIQFVENEKAENRAITAKLDGRITNVE